MSAPDDQQTTVTPNDFFESIGQKVDHIAPSANGADGLRDDDNDRVVEQIESLCMNCHENVSSCLSVTLFDNIAHC
jgi:zinc finger protein